MNPDTQTLGAVRLPYNPVWRSYAGGKALREFRGVEPASDDHFPEDWLASTIQARNGVHAQRPDEGLSSIGEAGNLSQLAQSFQNSPRFWFGENSITNTNVLWKLLDSSVRLQFQAHPDAAFARQRLNSNAGKTECWYILSTRGKACVYLGFQRPPSREAWANMIRKQDIAGMLSCFDPISVKAGDCFVVPAGTPHAIGAGVFMVELMEPTDWVVRCETLNAGVTLPPEACFMGLTLEECLNIFDYRPYSHAEVKERFQQRPRRVNENESFVDEEIISPKWHRFFRLHRLSGGGTAEWKGEEMLLIIAKQGKGKLTTGTETRELSAGQTWLLPGAAKKWRWEPASPAWEFIMAKLPRPNYSEAIGRAS